MVFFALKNAFAISLTDPERKLLEQGEITVKEIPTTGKEGKTFEAVGLIHAPRAKVIQILTEYEKYPEFMPNVSHIEIVARQNNESVLNYTLTLPLGKIKKYRLRLSLTQPDDRSSRLAWEMEKWPGLQPKETIKDTTGYWLIQDRTENSSLVLYHVYTDPGPVPYGLGWIIDVLSKNSVPEAFEQTRMRAEQLTPKAAP